MSDNKSVRINKVLKELNVSIGRVTEFFESQGIDMEIRPNTKIDQSSYELLLKNFKSDASLHKKSVEVSKAKKKEKESRLTTSSSKPSATTQTTTNVNETEEKNTKPKIKTLGKIDLDQFNKKPKKSAPKKEEEPKVEKTDVSTTKKDIPKPKKKEAPKEPEVVSNRPEAKVTGPKIVSKIDLEPKKTSPEKEEEEPQVKEEPSAQERTETPEETTPEVETIKTQYQKLDGVKLTGEKIDLGKFTKPKPSPKPQNKDADKKKRKRIVKSSPSKKRFNKQRTPREPKEELTDEQIQKQIKETLEKLTNKGKGGRKSYKFRKDKRDAHKEQREKELLEQEEKEKILEINEFVSVNELSTLMDVSTTEIISACMSLGIMVTLNQRLDAETITLVASEYDFEVNFITAEEPKEEDIQEENEEDLLPRAPIVTVMGHVDHGKTSLLDYIRKENVIAGEAGGITQHIAAYSVTLKDGNKISFLDTPGHEAFTAMRARGAQVTDIVIIVIAADDNVMPQTKEAISHAQAAGVPIIFAINKIDKPDANPDKVKETLAGMNLLVEDWGGKIQSQDISAKNGIGVNELLEKVMLEAELLELKANPEKNAIGTVIEASLDKGRGYVTSVMIQGGTLKMGDFILSGNYSGKVRAMLDERGKNLKEAGPSTPVTLLALDGAPQAGDKFKVYSDEKEAKNIASRRKQLLREQSIRTQKQMTLDEIGRRIAIGDFQELNLIIRGDVDGSVEALSDSLQKLSNEELQVNVVHKGVGQITESDVLLATASSAIIIGFQVRPTAKAKKIADKEAIDIRTYSIIYAAIDDVKQAMEGMLSPEFKEEVIGNVEIRETFKISKVGTIAGCMVTDGKITRNSSVRIIREGIVQHDGLLESLKRFKDDVKEVTKGYECGLNIKGYNDIQVGDQIEVYQQVQVQKKL